MRAEIVVMVASAVGLTSLGRDWLFLRAVERYRKHVGDHAKVVEFAAAVRPRGRPR